MNYTGLLIAESLIDEAFLNFVSITERKEGAIKFTVTDEFVLAVVEEISKALKPKSLANVDGEYEQFLIYPNKIFKFSLKDEVTRQKAIDYGKSLGL